VIRCRRWLIIILGVCCIGPVTAFAQIDPLKRELIQFGYNAAFEGHPPLSAYAFYYRNQPDFLRTNLTMRLAIAPTFLDSELGIADALGEHSDLGIGVAGGGFGDIYNEIDQGKYIPAQSFDGHDGELNLSLYHLFNPGQLIPLNGLLRGTAHYAAYGAAGQTDPNFKLPENMGIFKVRSGLRWGGREPTLFPALAMELSIWYQGEFRTQSDVYGYGDRRVESQSHLFWAEGFLAYTLPKSQQNFTINITSGTTIGADRFSAYRLGGFLPMIAEFPLSLPGYYYQELSAKRFALFSGNYILPIDKDRRWNLTATAATAYVDYLASLEQPGNWNSGVGAGVFYASPTWRVMAGYGYGIDAIRSHGRGAHSIGFLLQIDLAPAREAFFKPGPPTPWRGFQRLFDVFGS